MRRGPDAIHRSPSRIRAWAGSLVCVFVSWLQPADGFGQTRIVRDGDTNTNVIHDVILEGQDEYPDYVFYAYPRDLRRSDAMAGNICVPFQTDRPVDINRFNPLAVDRNEGVEIVAVPLKFVLKTGGSPDPSWFDGTSDHVFKAREKVIRHPQVVSRQGDPTRYVTRYRLLMDGELSLSLISDAPAPRMRPRAVGVSRLSPAQSRPPEVESWLVRTLRSIEPRTAIFAIGSLGVVIALVVVNRRGRTVQPAPRSERVPDRL
jgi:hypothetical protein